MKRIILALLFALGATTVSAAGGVGAEAPPLQIRIVDETGEPVSGARVRAGNAGEDGTLDHVWPEFEEEVVWSGETSPEGVVRLSELPLARAIWVLIEKEGFAPELRSVMLSRRVTCPEIGVTLRRGGIAAGQKLDTQLLEDSYPNIPEFLLDRVDREGGYVFPQMSDNPAGPEIRPRTDAVVTGWVTEPDGAPLSGTLLYASWRGGFAETVAADNGFFQLEGIPEGRVHVTARAVGFHGRSETLEVTGDRAAVDFTLTPGEEAITLRGRVMTANREPLEGAAVWISNLLVHSNRGGWFTLVVPSHWTGRSEIQAKKEGFGRGQTSFQVQGKCMTGIEVRLTEDTK